MYKGTSKRMMKMLGSFLSFACFTSATSVLKSSRLSTTQDGRSFDSAPTTVAEYLQCDAQLVTTLDTCRQHRTVQSEDRLTTRLFNAHRSSMRLRCAPSGPMGRHLNLLMFFSMAFRIVGAFGSNIAACWFGPDDLSMLCSCRCNASICPCWREHSWRIDVL